MNLILAMAFFFIFVTLVFVAIAVFLPEWMGITGKHAKRIIEEQQGDTKPTEETEIKTPDSSDKH